MNVKSVHFVGSYYMLYITMHGSRNVNFGCCIVTYRYCYVMVLRHTFMQVWTTEQVTDILDMTGMEQGL